MRHVLIFKPPSKICKTIFRLFLYIFRENKLILDVNRLLGMAEDSMKCLILSPAAVVISALTLKAEIKMQQTTFLLLLFLRENRS